MNNDHKVETNNHETGLEVAVIGMAGRFPGARDLEELWENLEKGIESIAFFSHKELENAGIAPALLQNPNYVKARGVLEDVEYFDASFFGYTPSEARLIDPQVRLFHQCAWHALEDAGCVPGSYEGLIGVYAGARALLDWPLKALFAPNDGTVDLMTTTILSSKDHLSTRISYMLNLRGPSYTFYTACSTSLVAIHLGCQAVLSGECDISLAGGVTVNFPQKRGHLYQEDLILSPDGHTRSFDADARGLMDGSGAGIVVLKSLEDARRDKDHIYAVVKGTGINNDGSRKIGYTAPSIKGQEALMNDVYSAAEVETESIAYIECHGSATPLGDPVEVEALRYAFHKTKGDHIGIGSVKTNFGHCDCAAGAASFIKTVLILKHRKIPPSLNFKTPNPKIDFENSPFYVNTHLKEWKNNQYPMRAAVNSLGLGGTNAHVILEEAPGDQWGSESVSRWVSGSVGQREYQLLLLSAKTFEALEKMTENLARHLKKNPRINLADAAYTLQTGRESFACRRAFVCSGIHDAVKQLSQPETAPVQPFPAGEKDRPLVFMYSGQGSEYIDMGRDLYEKEETFRKDIDTCFDYLTSIIGEDIKYILYPQNEKQLAEAEKKIHRFYYTQPVKFIFEYAYSHLLMRWGFKPHALIGYSFGEYMVACMAGVFSMEDALKVLMKRGDIMEKAPRGAMLTVSLPERELTPLLKPGLYIGGVNTDRLCLVSGEADAVDAFEKELEEKNIDFIRYRAACGGHSPVMDPILGELGEELDKITFNKPQIPYVSGITGTWITVEDATDPSYFTRQLRAPVRFAQALDTLFETPRSIFLEVGPGTTLVNFVNYYIESGKQPDIHALTMVRHHKDPVGDDCFLLNRAAQLWSYGKAMDWVNFYDNKKLRKVSLPLYPFEKQYYWIDFDPFKSNALGPMKKNTGKKPDIRDWFYLPSWKTTLPGTSDPIQGKKTWMVFMDPGNFGDALIKSIEPDGRTVIAVSPGDTFQRIADNQYRMDFKESSHYHELFKQLKDEDKLPSSIIHMGNLSRKNDGQSILEWNETVQDTGYYSLLYIAQAVGRQQVSCDMQIEIVTNGMQSVAGEPLDYPEKATVLGPVKIIPQEYPNLKCRTMDVVLPEPGTDAEELLIRQLKREFSTPQTREQVIAFREDRRLVQHFEPAPLAPSKPPIPCLKENGVYLIVGGLGGIGLTLAEALFKTLNAKIILTSRFGLPPRDQWENYLEENQSGEDDNDNDKNKIVQRIRKVHQLENRGADMMVAVADVSDEKNMQETVVKARQRFGPINGVIHCAYVPDGMVIDQRTRETTETVFAPKVKGALILHRIFEKQEPLDFFAICSSLAAIFGPLGQVGYTAASAFLDAFAHYRRTRTPLSTYNVSINWGGWAEVGALLDSVRNLASKLGVDQDSQYKNAMRPAEGVDAFARILTSNAPQVLVSTQELSFLLQHLNTSMTSLSFQEKLADKVDTKRTLLKRPQLKTDYVAPRTETEAVIAKVWQALFGLETVGVQDDFFELGGDSLKAMTTASKIHKELNKKIPIAVFFSSPTIEQLSQYINSDNETGTKDIELKETHSLIPRAKEKEYYPISPVVKPIYLHHRKNPENTYFNAVNCLHLPGTPDMDKLETTFKAIIERNESYRTSFHLIDGEPVQKIHSPGELDFRIHRCEFPGGSDDQLQDFISRLIKPFDLTRAPLFRATLIHVEKERSILLMETHHTIIDGTSAGLFTNQFMDLYQGKELPSLRIQYKDFSQWHYDRLQSGELEASEKYWLEQFSGPVSPLKLPYDFPPTDKPDFQGRPVWFNIDKDMVYRLRALVKETGATMFMVWLAAYSILLHKSTGQEDIVIGSRIACRLHTDLEKILGRFSNTLGFRCRLKPGQTFREFLEQVKEISLGAFKHQEYPFEQLIDRIDCQKRNPKESFFNTIFVYNNMGDYDDKGDGFKLAHYSFKKIKVLYDLLFQATEIGDIINVLIQYPTSFFKKETVDRMIRDFLDILKSIAEQPDIQLFDI